MVRLNGFNVATGFRNAGGYVCLLLCVLVFLAGCEQQLSDLPPDQRPIPAEQEMEQRASLRRLPVEGANNFRDLGGYPVAGGRITQWGLVYRSDALSDLTTDDQRYLQRLGLNRIVDLRSEQEQMDEPDRLSPELSAKYVAMPVPVSEADTQILMDKISEGNLTAVDSHNFLIKANRLLVDDYTELYSRWLHSLLDANNLPLVFHCTEGKDRTGFGAALLLLTLGADKELVMQDYLASNQYLEASVDRRLTMMRVLSLFQMDTSAIRPVFTVSAEFIQSAFNRIDERYGSFDRYLREGLDIDETEQAQLIAMLTVARPAP